MTELQSQILQEIQCGNVNIHDLAYRIGRTVQGIRVAVSKMDGFQVNGVTIEQEDIQLVDPAEEIAALKAEIARLKQGSAPRFVNLTNHEVTIQDDNTGELIVFPPSGIHCRVETLFEDGYVDGVPVTSRKFGKIYNYPDEEGEIYIVSGLCGEALHAEGYTNMVVPKRQSATDRRYTKFWRRAYD